MSIKIIFAWILSFWPFSTTSSPNVCPFYFVLRTRIECVRTVKSDRLATHVECDTRPTRAHNVWCDDYFCFGTNHRASSIVCYELLSFPYSKRVRAFCANFLLVLFFSSHYSHLSPHSSLRLLPLLAIGNCVASKRMRTQKKRNKNANYSWAHNKYLFKKAPNMYPNKFDLIRGCGWLG